MSRASSVRRIPPDTIDTPRGVVRETAHTDEAAPVGRLTRRFLLP